MRSIPTLWVMHTYTVPQLRKDRAITIRATVGNAEQSGRIWLALQGALMTISIRAEHWKGGSFFWFMRIDYMQAAHSGKHTVLWDLGRTEQKKHHGRFLSVFLLMNFIYLLLCAPLCTWTPTSSRATENEIFTPSASGAVPVWDKVSAMFLLDLVWGVSQ